MKNALIEIAQQVVRTLAAIERAAEAHEEAAKAYSKQFRWRRHLFGPAGTQIPFGEPPLDG